MITQEHKAQGSVLSVNISEQKGTAKSSVPEAEITAKGVAGDAHAGSWHRQVSMLSEESMKAFAEKNNRKISPGDFGENITTRGLNLSGVNLLDRFIVGTTELEVTQMGKKCHGSGCAIFKETGECIMPDEGIFLRVTKKGKIKAGDSILHFPRTLLFKIITLSDKAAAGEFEDTSGPEVKKILHDFYKESSRHIHIDYKLIPDNSEELIMELQSLTNNSDVIITTGGTGIGPRDITPDTVASVCQKMLPGIMEHIRLKYGAENPRALLSRSVAGIMKQTIIYTLPGSVKAVREYMTEILKTMEHSIFMLHGLGH